MEKAIYTKEHKELVAKLRQARLVANLSQKEVARLLDCRQPFISIIESGQRKIDIILLKNLAKIYKKPLDYFLK